MLCSAEQWAQFDADSDIKTFYDRIVDLFESRPEHPWVKETLEWFEKRVMSTKISFTLICWPYSFQTSSGSQVSTQKTKEGAASPLIA